MFPTREVVHACRTCNDFGWVTDGYKDEKCPECSVWNEDKRVEMLKQAIRRSAEKPSITTADLSDDERATLREWTLKHPEASELTMLTWIEGRRYDPARDQEFLVEARKAFKKWKFLRGEC